jgi:hypothetical protein
MKRFALVFALLSVVAGSQVIQHGVTLSCTQSGTGTATFSVYRAIASGAEAKPALASNLATCSYLDSTAVIGTKYYYTMTETVGGVESGPSVEVSAQIPVPPNPPTNPAAAVQ